MDQILQKLQQAFQETYQADEQGVYFAPGRVNLIGEHIDYNGGHVFPCAITQGTYALMQRRQDNHVRCYSMNFEDVGIIEFSLDDLTYKKEDRWTNYVKGVFKYVQEESGQPLGGMDLLIYGNIPNGAGLSSSASLELLIGVLLKDVFNLSLTQLDLVKIGQRVENQFIGVNSGIMDQFAVGMGQADHAIFLDVNTLDYELVPAVFGDYRILIMNTNKRRELADSKYNERRSECEAALAELQEVVDIKELCDLSMAEFEKYQDHLSAENLLRRARHCISEDERTLEAKRVLTAGDLVAFGKLLNASHQSLKDDYEVTGIELDTLVDLAQKSDHVLGARMTGAGMGGCAIALAHKDHIDEVIAKITPKYEATIGYQPDFYVAAVGRGASKLR